MDTKPQQDLGPEDMVAPVAKTGPRPPVMPATPVQVPPRPAAGAARPNTVEATPAARPAGAPAMPSPTQAMISRPDSAKPEKEMRQLIIGRDISLAGEIHSCDRLVVEGSVQTQLSGCHDITIAEGGLFKGSATIEEAEIRGRFEGDITVARRLLVRATGRITGSVRYGQLEIECGGQIIGDLKVHQAELPLAHQPRDNVDAGAETREGQLV